ncbi:MAG: dethiobiotin synthase [Endomicrobiales bacterium]|nr:dethiobiotin synthase [Endomicrobiales bacterium]
MRSARKGVFITATDTGAGKTYFACKLAEELRKKGFKVGVFKPFASGDRRDAVRLIKSAGIRENIDVINPMCFKYPLAPMVSASLEKRNTHLKAIFRSFNYLRKKYEYMIVEGAGGVLVPLARDYQVIDLIKDLKLPSVIVAKPGLGTINHTLLTIGMLKTAKLPVAGIVLSNRSGNGLAEKTNPGIIRELANTNVLELERGNKINLGECEWLIKV